MSASHWVQKLQQSAPQALAEAVRHDAARSAFMVGAGISIKSGLPSFRKFELAVLDRFIGAALSPKEMQEVALSLRPEVLIQALWQTYDEDVFQAYKMLEGGQPNSNHYLLAEALRQGACVVTTNVDTLIEDACRALGFRNLKVAFAVEHFKDIRKKSLDGCLLKVHGTIDRSKRGNRRFLSIRMALDHVGRGIDELTAAVMLRVIRDRDLLVLGYSANDHFSVQPLLAQSASDQAIAWFMFDPQIVPPRLEEGRSRFRELRDAMYESVYDGRPPDMTRSSEHPDQPSWEAISVYEILQNRQHSMLIQGDTSQIAEEALRLLATSSGQKILRASGATKARRAPATRQRPCRKHQQYEAAARILAILPRVTRAREVIRESQKLRGANKAVLSNLLAACDTIERGAYKRDELDAARRQYGELFRAGQFVDAVETSLAVANGYRIAREFEAALEVLDESETMLKTSNFKERIRGYDKLRLHAYLQFLRGLALGLGGQQTLNEKVRGLAFLEEAAKAASLVGDVARRAAILNGKGLILYQIAEQMEGVLQLSEDSLDESLGLYARLQNPRSMFQPLRNQIMVHQLRSEFCDLAERQYWLQRARRRYDAASEHLRRVEENGTQGQDRAELELRAGQLCLETRQEKLAARHLSKAYKIAKQTSDLQRHIRILAERIRANPKSANKWAKEGLKVIDTRIREGRGSLLQDAIQTLSLMRSAYQFAATSAENRQFAIGLMRQLEEIMDEAGNRLVKDSIARHRKSLEAA